MLSCGENKKTESFLNVLKLKKNVRLIAISADSVGVNSFFDICSTRSNVKYDSRKRGVMSDFLVFLIVILKSHRFTPFFYLQILIAKRVIISETVVTSLKREAQ